MLNEAINSAKEQLSKNKNTVFLVLLLIFGVLLISLSSSPYETQKEETSSESLEEYKARLEDELGAVCSSVRGVGKCRVTVTFERGEERIYKGSSLIESRPPKVMGVTVVCKGADSDTVRAEIVGMMSALFDIGTNRIAVLKLNS